MNAGIESLKRSKVSIEISLVKFAQTTPKQHKTKI
jgi:hypothetical protein